MNLEKSQDQLNKKVVELIQSQDMIIRTQSEVIQELFIVLGCHISAEEIDNLPQVRKLNGMAKVKEYINMEPCN